MPRLSRLRVFLAVIGLFYAALLLVAVVIFHNASPASPDGIVPTLFVLPDISTTKVPTVRPPSVAANPSSGEAIALAPTNTTAPTASPTATMTPTQASVALASYNPIAPTDAPLWSAPQAPAQVDAPPAVVDAPAEAVPNQVVVRFQPNTSDEEKQAYIESIGGTVDKQIDPLNTVVVNVPDASSVETSPDNSIIANAEPDYYLSALDTDAASNDPALFNQWALPAIGAPSAWSLLPADAATVVVAVIDSGICASHPDLADHLVAGWDFVESDDTPQDELGHGCSVAGVIAADVDNSLGIAGVAPNARIMPLRVLNGQGVGRYSDVAAAIIYAADHGAQVINLSLGGTNTSDTLEDAINYAVGKGLTIVAASGNTGTSGVLYPAAYAPVVAVGSVDPDLKRSSFSTYGPEVDLMAPGRNILTTTLNGDYGYVSGTSFAAPHVAGVVALDRALGVQLPSSGLVYAGSAPVVEPTAPTEEATAALIAPETTEVTPTETTPIDSQYADLLQKVQQNGHIRLIVGLNVGFRPEGALSGGDAVEAQRAAIAQAQGDVISALSAYDVSITAQYEVIPYMALTADEDALRALATSPDVTSLREDKPVPPIAVTNTSLIGADASWALGYKGAGQTVAVLDTGVDKSHPYLGGRVVAESCHSTVYSLGGVTSLCPNGQSSQSGSGAASPAKCAAIDVCSHGTHVSGIAAGSGSGQSGVAPAANIIAVQIFSIFSKPTDCGGAAPCLLSYDSDQISGLEDIYNLRNNYSISSINMSLGGGKYTGYCDSIEAPMKAMIDSLRAVGIATVIAAGNDGYTNALSAPGCISTAISVGATDLNDKIASWSNRASFLSLFAPGVSINSSVIGGGFEAWSGTSMATPHVTGAFALLRSYAPNASVTDILNALRSSGKAISGSSTPRIQLDAALVALGLPSVPTATYTPTYTPTFTRTPTMTPSPTPQSDVLFADGFESGNLTAWTASSTDGGNLSSTSAAGLLGVRGLQAVVNDNHVIYVNDDTPNAAKSYRARFYFDPNSIKMSSGDEFYLFYGYSGSSTLVTRIEMQRSSSLYQLRASIVNDGSTWTSTSWYTISDATHMVEIYWLASTSTTAKNGSITLWLDGAQKGSVSGIDNDTRMIDRVRLGALDGIDSNTRGTIYFDAFESRKTTYIGLPAGGINNFAPTPSPTPSPTLTPTPRPDLIFADGFESGNLTAWTASSTDSGNLSSTSAAGLVGVRGLQAVINDSHVIYVNDDRPVNEKTYHARYYFDPNSIKMNNGDEFYQFYGYNSSSSVVMRVEMQRASSQYQLRASAIDDSGSWKNTSWYTITDAAHAVEIYWVASTSTTAKNGSITLWLDGAQKGSVSGIDNDTRNIERVRLGALDGIDSNTRGTIFFDAFESRRFTTVGLASGASVNDLSADEPTQPPTDVPPMATASPTATMTLEFTATEAPLPTATDVPPTETLAPTLTATPTDLPTATATDIPPTETPLPTATDVPPTATDEPPTNTPEPPAEEQHADSTDEAG